MNRKTMKIGMAAAGLLAAATAQALPSDQQQPVQLEADQVEIDDQSGVSLYQGNVVLTRGSIRMNADKMTVRSHDGEFQRVELEGKPATYRWRPAEKGEEVQAEGRRIDYDVPAGLVTLEGGARLNQGENVFASEHILYDMKKDRVKAGGGAGGGDKQRVKITFQPKEGQPEKGKAKGKAKP